MMHTQMDAMHGQQVRAALAIEQSAQSLHALHAAAGVLDGKLTESLANEVRDCCRHRTYSGSKGTFYIRTPSCVLPVTHSCVSPITHVVAVTAPRVTPEVHARRKRS